MGKSERFDDRAYSESAFEKKLEQHRNEKEKFKKMEKKRKKEMETPEEKIIRRMAKKLRKEEQRKASSGNILPESIPYTDLNNPFNDTNLTGVFVWNKKLELEGKSNLSKKKIEKMSRNKIHSNVAEMEELKRNREARQSAKEDMEMIARDKERSQYSDFRRHEDQFHLKQAQLRSQIRIKERRAKPIDMLANYIQYDKDEIEEFEFDDPINYIKGCSLEDFEDLVEDIKVYKVLHKNKHDTFWDDITAIAQNEIRTRKGRNDETKNIHMSVMNEIVGRFKGKTYDELVQLNAQIRNKISTAGRGVNVGFWEASLDLLNPYMAKQRLKELHSKMLKTRLQKIREEQSREMAKFDKDNQLPGPSKISSPVVVPEVKRSEQTLKEEEAELKSLTQINLPFKITEISQWDDEVKEQKFQILNKEQLNFLSRQLYNAGAYSPSYGKEAQAMPGIEILDELEDRKKLEQLRQQNKRGGNGIKEQKFEIEEDRICPIPKDERNDWTSFSNETVLEQESFLWADKYRPQKPRYFNRVNTGFDWNKYNQTHYDVDNPPPKIVQGYRFNIFYPDLLDVSNTPSFKLIACDDPDFVIIRFKGGPPYEDIAFKIVQREWEINHKNGYKCQFQNGIFQLWFYFKRYRYRR